MKIKEVIVTFLRYLKHLKFLSENLSTVTPMFVNACVNCEVAEVVSKFSYRDL